MRHCLPSRILSSLLLLISWHLGYAADATDWRYDIDAIVRDMTVVHPDPFTKTTRDAFLTTANHLKADLGRLTEQERMVRAMQLVALIGDGHTWLEPNRPDFAKW